MLECFKARKLTLIKFVYLKKINPTVRKDFLRKNISCVLFFRTVCLRSHFLNTKQLHYVNSLKHGNI